MLEILCGCFLALVILFVVDRCRTRAATIDALDTRYIFVTGCDTGFGKLLVRRLDGLGCHVIAGCLTESGRLDLRQVCSSRVKAVDLDVTDSDSVRKAYEFVTNVLPVQSRGM